MFEIFITDVYTTKQYMKKGTILFLIMAVSLTSCKKYDFKFDKSYEYNSRSIIYDNTNTEIIEPTINKKQDIKKIALITGNIEKESQKYVYNAMLKEAYKFDKEMVVIQLGSNDKNNYKDQIKIVESCIKEKYDCIVLSDVNGEKLKNILKKAKNQGIFIVSLEEIDKLKNEVDVTINFEEKQIGEKSAENIGKLLSKKGEIDVVLTKKELEEKNGVYEGFKMILANKEYKNIKVKQIIIDDPIKQNGKDILGNILKVDKKIDVIWSVNKKISEKLSDALMETRRFDTILITCGESEKIKDELRLGCIYSTTQEKESVIGEKAVYYAIKLIKGEKIKQKKVNVGVNIIEHKNEE